MQFTYRTDRGVEDATCILLNMFLKHLEGINNYICLLFVDFSSVFKCIQPHILAKKLLI